MVDYPLLGFINCLISLRYDFNLPLSKNNYVIHFQTLLIHHWAVDKFYQKEVTIFTLRSNFYLKSALHLVYYLKKLEHFRKS